MLGESNNSYLNFKNHYRVPNSMNTQQVYAPESVEQNNHFYLIKLSESRPKNLSCGTAYCTTSPSHPIHRRSIYYVGPQKKHANLNIQKRQMTWRNINPCSSNKINSNIERKDPCLPYLKYKSYGLPSDLTEKQWNIIVGRYLKDVNYSCNVKYKPNEFLQAYAYIRYYNCEWKDLPKQHFPNPSALEYALSRLIKNKGVKADIKYDISQFVDINKKNKTIQSSFIDTLGISEKEQYFPPSFNFQRNNNDPSYETNYSRRLRPIEIEGSQKTFMQFLNRKD